MSRWDSVPVSRRRVSQGVRLAALHLEGIGLTVRHEVAPGYSYSDGRNRSEVVYHVVSQGNTLLLPAATDGELVAFSVGVFECKTFADSPQTGRMRADAQRT